MLEEIPFYKPIGNECAIFEAAYHQQLPLLIKGPTGCGKTRFITHMAARLGRSLQTVSCHDDLTAADLTRALEAAYAAYQPPLVRGHAPKLRYAHQGGRNPPVVVIHGNQTQHVPDAYRRFLENHFRETFRLKGTPMRVEFRTDENPFKGRRNELTPRQVRSKKRLIARSRGGKKAGKR